MTSYLRQHGEGKAGQIPIDNESWDLDVQLRSLLKWMNEHPDFNSEGAEWIVDVGYEPRPNAVVAGYTVSVELMTILVRKNVTLWFSDYLNDDRA